MPLFESQEVDSARLKVDLEVEMLRRAAGKDPCRLAQAAQITLHPWQRQFLTSGSKRILLNCHRQSGKSTLAGLRALWQALYNPDSIVLLVAPALRQSQILFWKVIGPYKRLGKPVPSEQETQLTLHLTNGSRIISLPGNADNIRGYTADLVIIDEAAYLDNNGDDLYYALRPMLLAKDGDMMLLSTPHGRTGIFYDEWSGGDPSWERYEVPVYMSPHIPPEAIEEERKKGDNYFAQEWECQFRDVVDPVFPYKVIDAAFDPDLEPLYL